MFFVVNGHTACRIYLLMLLLVWPFILRADPLQLTDKEQAFLQSHPVIHLGVDAGYGPYTFINQQGQFSGVVADLLPLLEQQLGVHFEISADLSWSQLMQALSQRQLDAVATVVKIPERESFIEFSQVYLPTPLIVTTRIDSPRLSSPQQLQNLRLVLVKDYSSTKQLLARFPQLNPFYVTTALEGLQAVSAGSADAYVGVLGVNTFLANQNGLTNLTVNSVFDMVHNGQRFGVRKDWPVLASLINKALAAIPENQKLTIFHQWMPPHAEQINKLTQPGFLSLLAPLIVAALGLVVVAYLVILFWNKQLKIKLRQRSVRLHRALDEVKRRESVLESVFDSLPDLFFLMEEDGTILEYRASRLNDLYVPPEVFLGRRMQDVLPPDVAAIIDRNLALVRETKQLLSFEYDLQIKNEKKHFEARLNRLAGSDQYISVNRDISEEYLQNTRLEESEAHYRELMENMTDGFVALDSDWHYVFVNNRAAQMLGHKAEALIGRNIWEEFPEGIDQPFYHAYHKAFKEQLELQIEEYFEPWDLWFENRIYPTASGISIFFQDISIRKRAEIALQQSRDELEKRVEERTAELADVNQELETFTYSVSHDLKAPLRGIDGYSQLLLQEHAPQLDEDGRLMLENVRHGVEQMNQLIEDLLTYSRMERRQLQHQTVDLSMLMQQIVNEREQDLLENSVKLTVDLDAIIVHADPEGLTIVLRNLLDNAIKFSASSQPPEIVISGTQQAQSVIISCQDNGIGFNMRFHDRIFAIFQRLQRAEDYPGTGVGLAIVNKAMQRMGGRVWAESTPGEGTTFFLELVQ